MRRRCIPRWLRRTLGAARCARLDATPGADAQLDGHRDTRATTSPREPGIQNHGSAALRNQYWIYERDGVSGNAKDPGPLATITDGLTNPFGACIDGQGTLYVTNVPASSGWVSEYPLGKTTPSRVITGGIREPAYCAIMRQGTFGSSTTVAPTSPSILRAQRSRMP